MRGNSKDIVISRDALVKSKLDIGGRDILIGFNEPTFKFSSKNLTEGDLDSKLNARLVSYFLPIVQIARMQPRRLRVFVISGLNMALLWNAKSERQKKIMMINNYIKLDFLKKFFEKFFPDDFSIIEYAVSQDPIKVSENKLLAIWKVLERKYPSRVKELKISLAKYKRPKLFINRNDNVLSDEIITILNSKDEDIIGAFKYAVSHLFAMADINFEGNYIHNPVGYLTIGGPTEKVFNEIRKLALSVLQGVAEIVFERDVIFMDNLRLVLETNNTAPLPYNGYFESYGNDKLRLVEATYENGEPLSFYDNNKQLKQDMDYIYNNFLSRKDYEKFWNSYRERYFDLKKRYREAYGLEEDF